MSTAPAVRGYHAHVYFDADTQAAAERLRDAIGRSFEVVIGRIHATPVGPHPKGMFEVDITPEQFSYVVPWLMFNRDGLSILVHPVGDDPVADHETNALWMGDSLPLDIEFVREWLDAKKKKSEQEVSK